MGYGEIGSYPIFESVRLAHHLSIARCLSAGLGVPLHTLMLITITKRKYLANGYSLDEYIFPDKEVKKSSVRRRLDAELDKLNYKELSVIEATVIGLCKAKEPED